MREEIRELLKELHEMGSEAASCITLLQGSFISNAPKPLKDCREKAELLEQRGAALTQKAAEAAKEIPEMKEYLTVPVHLQRIAEDLGKLAVLMEKKAKDNILFSDRAITEIGFLLQRLLDVIKPASELILDKNTLQSRYVQESETGIVGKANAYATLHEERLIEGLCLPVASSIYLAMLDSIKGIAWNAKEIALRLSE